MNSGSLVGVGFLLAALTLNGCSIYGPDLFTSGGVGGTASSGGASSGSAPSGGKAGSGGDSFAGSSSSGGESSSTGGVASGGTATGGGTASGGGSATMIELIDDLEDNDVTVIYTAVEKRNGHWDVANDGTAGTISPSVGFSIPEDVSGEPPHPNSNYALHMSGSGFTSWGASLNVSLLASGAYDASAYTGVAFWAKAGSSGVKKVAVRLVSGDTDPRGGICKTSGMTTELCFDHFYADVPLTTAWEYHVVPFSDFHQKNAGMQFPSIDTAQAYGFEFFFGANQTFELWVDDFAFTKN